MNTFAGLKVFIAGVHAGPTHNDTYLRDQALEIVPLVQIEVEPTMGPNTRHQRRARWPMAKQRISSVQADEMYML